MLDERSPELLDALDQTLRLTFGKDKILTTTLHTGGGNYVAAIDLSIDGRFQGRQVWLTRDDESTWIVGFYDFYRDPEDEGVFLCLCGMADRASSVDSPLWVAAHVAAILTRLGVTTLQGE